MKIAGRNRAEIIQPDDFDHETVCPDSPQCGKSGDTTVSVQQFVEVVTPISDYTYRWKLNTGSKKEKHERADLMAVTGKPVLTFTIDFETAKKYREANKMPHQFRRAAWSDLTVEVYL